MKSLPLLVGLVGLAPTPAAAATTFGSVSTTPNAQTSNATGYVVVQGDAPSTSFAAPSGGVVTSVSARASVGALAIGIVRGSFGSPTTVVGRVAMTGTGVDKVTTTAARIPVQAGDRLAAELVAGGAALGATTATTAALRVVPGSLPATGGTLASGTSTSGQEIVIAATLEADADGDGYGDETQDSCPTDATVTTGPCIVDLSLAGSTATVPVGIATVIFADVAVSSPSPTTTAKVVVGAPAGVEVLGIATSGGNCADATCALSTLAPGQVRRVYAVVRAAQPGSYALTFAGSAGETLVRPADDVATGTLTVTAPAGAGGTGRAVRLCTVPKLRGLSRTGAQSALERAGCALGKVSGAKRKKAKVSTQTVPTGTQVLAGTKVGVRLR